MRWRTYRKNASRCCSPWFECRSGRALLRDHALHRVAPAARAGLVDRLACVRST